MPLEMKVNTVSSTRGPRRQQRRPRQVEQVPTPDQRWRRILGRATWALVGLAATALVVWLAIGEPALEGPVQLALAARVEAARADAGCEVVATTPAGDGTHLDDDVTIASVDTGDVQPPTGAPHYQGTNFLVDEGIDRQLDVLSVGHNLEHGAVVAWYDPEAVDASTVEAMQDWSGLLNNSGFSDQPSGAGLFVAPYSDPGISSGAGVALRAWGLGVDCQQWDETAANSFLIEAYGNRDMAPEGVAYPDGTLTYVGQPPMSYRESATG